MTEHRKELANNRIIGISFHLLKVSSTDWMCNFGHFEETKLSTKQEVENGIDWN